MPRRPLLPARIAAARHRQPVWQRRGVKRTVLAGLLSLSVTTGVVAPVALAALPAGSAQAAPATTPGNWYYNSSLTTLIERTPAGVETTIPLTGQVFSIALDPTQKQLYAVGAATAADYRVLKKVDLDGTVTSLGTISGLPAKQAVGYANAAFDTDGILYISGQKVLGGPSFLWSVDVHTVKMIKETALTGDTGGDLAFLDGSLYTLDGGLSRIDIATGTVTKTPIAGLASVTAAMFSSRGHLYMNSGNNLVEIVGYDTATPTAVTVGTLTTPSDGASDPTDPNPFLAATDDGVGSIPRGTSAGNVLANDLLNGVAITDPTVVSGSVTDDGGATGVTIGSDGSIVVPAGVANGTYTITYTVCETANTGICDTASATFTVIDNITAVADTLSSTTAGGTAGNVLGNDTINGAVLDPTDVTVTFGSDGGLTGATIDASGDVVVPAGAAPGDYTLSYTICQKSDPANCSTADVVVTVAHDAIDLGDDDLTTTPVKAGGSTGSVLDNDTINGSPIDPSSVTISLTDDGGLSGATIAGDGTITVPAGAKAGDYTLTYQVCQDSDATNCATAEVTIAVSPAALVANPNDFSAAPIANTGGPAGNVLTDDTIDGAAIDPASVTIDVTTDGGLSGVAIGSDGALTVPANAKPGTYTVGYQVCEKLNPTNCVTSTATVVIQPAVVVTTDDDFSATVPATGGVAGNVLTNDTVNGTALVPSTVTVALTDDGGLTGATIAADGTLTVPAGATAGTYTLTYTVCLVNDPTNCSTSSITVEVVAAAATAPAASAPVSALASTGSTIAAPFLALGALLVALGGALIILRRRRTRVEG